MKLYKPVRIESAEQAEALADDAIVIADDTGERYTKSFEGDWWGVTEGAVTLAVDVQYDKITALVPIEAEEEATGALVNRVGEIRWEGSTRYVTPWEDA